MSSPKSFSAENSQNRARETPRAGRGNKKTNKKKERTILRPAAFVPECFADAGAVVKVVAGRGGDAVEVRQPGQVVPVRR